jgi:hypothetical protein
LEWIFKVTPEERTTQHWMPIDNLLPRLLEGHHVQITLQTAGNLLHVDP